MPADAVAVSRALDEWWEQRLDHCVQPQLFEHFGDTTLSVEDRVGLLVFHRSIGLTLEPGDEVIDGVPVHRDRVGIGGDYVVFHMDLRDGLV